MLEGARRMSMGRSDERQDTYEKIPKTDHCASMSLSQRRLLGARRAGKEKAVAETGGRLADLAGQLARLLELKAPAGVKPYFLPGREGRIARLCVQTQVICYNCDVSKFPEKGLNATLTNATMGFLKTAYLAVYNAAQCVGWFIVLVKVITAYVNEGEASVWGAMHTYLEIFQTLAVLEIFHSMIGLVRAPILTTLPQVCSRLLLTWGVLYSVPEVREHWMVLSLAVSWGVTEVIRYGFFTCKELMSSPPYFLLWLRYTTFYILYITGVASEIGLLYMALKPIQDRKLYNYEMPNRLNVTFDYYIACMVALIFYIPGFPYLYTHMISQRSRQLNPRVKKA
eukprot:jgi/Mesvir1/17565/Mv08808-RA.1